MRTLCLTVSAILAASPVLSEEPAIGRASVVDGDTIDIQGERIRLNGIDAPESRQLCNDSTDRPYQCGRIAADALDQYLAASRPTRCDFINRDRYKRFVGNCFRADGQSVAAWMTRNGHALDWPRYSKRAYAGDQEAAKAAGMGVWQGKFENPWDWRKKH